MHKNALNEFLRDAQTLAPELQRMMFVAESRKRIVGVSILNRMAGMYHPQKFFLELGVLEGSRQKGIGTALYEMTLSHLRSLDAISASTQVSEQNEAGMKFAASRGYVEEKRDFISALDVGGVPTGWLEESRRAMVSEGIVIRSLRAKDTPEIRREWFDVFAVVRHDVPRSEPPTPLTFEFFDENVVEEPDLVKEATLFAMKDGKIVGFTAGYHDGSDNHFDQWLTAVARGFRGRGIAMALKLEQIAAVKQLGIKSIKTDNDTRNEGMLAVNGKLGFVRQPAVLSLRKEF